MIKIKFSKYLFFLVLIMVSPGIRGSETYDLEFIPPPPSIPLPVVPQQVNLDPESMYEQLGERHPEGDVSVFTENFQSFFRVNNAGFFYGVPRNEIPAGSVSGRWTYYEEHGRLVPGGFVFGGYLDPGLVFYGNARFLVLKAPLHRHSLLDPNPVIESEAVPAEIGEPVEEPPLIFILTEEDEIFEAEKAEKKKKKTKRNGSKFLNLFSRRKDPKNQ